MAEREAWTPERIRELRGNESRAAFAARVGVSALTVYRWELPDDAPEARRPRGAMLARLEALVPGVSPAATEDVAELMPLLEALLNGEFRRAEEGIMALSASGVLRSSASRALATQALARIQLWERADVRGAFATLFPQIAEADAGALPADVAREVYITAALVFSALDGRVFDAGKVSAYVARAERLLDPGGDPRDRMLLWLAQLSAALTLNDPALVEHHVARGADIAQELTSPLLRCYVEEISASWGFMLSQPTRAARHFAEAVRLAQEQRFHLVHGRASAQSVRQRVDEGERPAALLEAVQRIETTFREARVAPAWHSMFLAYAAGEAHFRLGELTSAESAVMEGLRIAEELRWPPAVFPMLAARLFVLTGRKASLRALSDRLRAQRPAVFVELHAAIADCTEALADVVEGRDPEGAVDRFDTAVRRIEVAGGWSYLRRHMALANAALAVFAGTAEQAGRALRHGDRTLAALPAVWASAAFDALRGVHEVREGRPSEARGSLERALAAFVRVGDEVHAALTQLVLVAALTEPTRESTRAAALEALQRFGITPPQFERRAGTRSGREAPTSSSHGLIEAIDALARPGPSVTQLHRELIECVARILPGRAVRLEALDVAPAIGEECTVHDLGDTHRLAIVGPLDADDAATVSAIVSVARLALEVASLRGLVDRARVAASETDVELPGFVSASPVTRRLKEDLARLSRSRATIIVTGESGVGKEIVARAIHDLSARKGRPYVTFNCAAVPRELFEGQLFGYKKGAFTGATADHPGVIRAAHGGTLFLDEVGELPLDVQPKLLRFLENREIMPLGERAPIEVDVRVIAATLRDLEKLVREGRFREDLFYRLQVVPLHIAPLRERPEDVVALARHFVRRFTPEGTTPPTLGPDAIVALTSHDWPGNARELRNVIERALAFEPLPAALSAASLSIARS